MVSKSYFIVIGAILIVLLSSTVHAGRDSVEPDCVVVLHGMGRTSASMSYISRKLTKAGFDVVNFGYPSTEYPIETLAENYLPAAIRQCSDSPDIHVHFVTHSLGGILVRYYLQRYSLPKGSRIVMLAPPNRGSEVAGALKDNKLYEWITGPPGQQLGSGENGLPNKLAPIDYQIGIIAGRDTMEPWFSSILPGEDDGKVSVENTKLNEMTDFLVVDATHTFIMNNSQVIDATIRFLKTGKFNENRD